MSNKLELEKIENLITSDIPTVVMHRIKLFGKRGYVRIEPFALYSGLTGALSAATFKNNQDEKRLEGWRRSMVKQLGSDEAQESYLNSMADYGTISHEVLVRIKKNGSLDWNFEKEHAYKYFNQSAINNGIIPNQDIIEKQVFEFCKSAASLMQFIYENVSEIKAVESMCFCDDLQIATPIDLVCVIKNQLVTINLKTSEQFSDHQREQVTLEKYMWNKTYPEFKAAQTGLFRAKKWLIKKGIPSYDFELLKPEIEEPLLKDALQRLMLCKSNPNSTYFSYPKDVISFDGKTKAGEIPKIISKSIEQVITEAFKPVDDAE
jgi:hypothetical protein